MSRYIALFAVSGYMKKLFSIDYVSIYLFSASFFHRFCVVEKCGFTPDCLYRDSLTSRTVRKIKQHVYTKDRDVLYCLIKKSLLVTNDKLLLNKEVKSLKFNFFNSILLTLFYHTLDNLL